MADRQNSGSRPGGEPRRPDSYGGPPRRPSSRGGEPRRPDSYQYREPRRTDPRGGEPRRTDPRGGEPRRTDSRSSEPRRTDPHAGERRRPESYEGDRRQQSPRRSDVIRCENCGEDYSVTYKRCPFCDERPGRGGVSGKRVANTRGGGYGRPASTLRTATWIGSFVVVLAAMFIIYRFIGSPIFGGGKDPDPKPGASSSQGPASSGSNQPGIGDTSTPQVPDGSGGGTPDQPDAPVDPATPDPEPDPTPTPDPPLEPDPEPSGGTIAPGTRVKIVNAGSGLNIRSGPGTENSVVASASNGAEVTVVGEENGWYRVRYNGSQEGYVRKDFVSAR